MNNKGFTTIELLLTMVLVITIMFSITSVTNVYRDRSQYEEIKTDITNYKNTLTKVIYDDILDNENKVINIVRDNNSNKIIYMSDDSSDTKTVYLKYILKTKNNSDIPLEMIVKQIQTENSKIKNIYLKGINYNGVDYLFPGGEDSLISLEETRMYPNDYPNANEGNIYSLDLIFSHKNLEDPFKIHFVIENS